MKCSKCKKNYKDTMPTCPKCGEVNHKMLEDKTIAIQEINEDLSLTGLINNQIEEFNEEEKEVKKVTKKKTTKRKSTKEGKFGSKKDIKLRKKILSIGLGISMLVIFSMLCIVIYFRSTNDKYDYVYELNLIMDDYDNIKDNTSLYDVLAYVSKDNDKKEIVHTNIYDSINDWIANYKKKEYYSVDDFDENTETLKDNIKYIFDIDYKKIKLLDYEEYEDFIKEINSYYNDGKVFYEAVGYYNKNYYNQAYAMFDAVDEENQFNKKAIKYKDKIINDVLTLLNNDIEKLENDIKDDSTDKEKVEVYLEIENIIIVYDDIYSNLNLVDNDDYQSMLTKYRELTK